MSTAADATNPNANAVAHGAVTEGPASPVSHLLHTAFTRPAGLERELEREQAKADEEAKAAKHQYARHEYETHVVGTMGSLHLCANPPWSAGWDAEEAEEAAVSPKMTSAKVVAARAAAAKKAKAEWEAEAARRDAEAAEAAEQHLATLVSRASSTKSIPCLRDSGDVTNTAAAAAASAAANANDDHEHDRGHDDDVDSTHGDADDERSPTSRQQVTFDVPEEADDDLCRDGPTSPPPSRGAGNRRWTLRRASERPDGGYSEEQMKYLALRAAARAGIMQSFTSCPRPAEDAPAAVARPVVSEEDVGEKTV